MTNGWSLREPNLDLYEVLQERWGCHYFKPATN